MSNKSQFIRHQDPAAFIAQERCNRPHIPHSVALLVLSPNGDQIATAVSGNAVKRGVDYIQSPLQLRMTQQRVHTVSPCASKNAHQTVQRVALVIAQEFLNMEISEYNNQHFYTVSGQEAMKHNRLWYVGTTRGNKRGDAGRVVRHGRYVHWVLMRSKQYRGVFRKESFFCQQPRWVNVKRLHTLPQSELMSPRKLEMIDQTMLMYYQVTGNYNSLVAEANKHTKLRMVA